ncbi:MAG: glycogen phosphorylase, partial [Planctomycetes bacterium]|nr:glycogen phosphorylase [Planctomycetota bacterium]
MPRTPTMIPAPVKQREVDELKADIRRHIVSTLGNDDSLVRKDTHYNGLAYSVRDRLMHRWIRGQRACYDQQAKRVYYLSMEFLPGRFLMNYITNMQIKQLCDGALYGLPFNLEDVEEEEW